MNKIILRHTTLLITFFLTTTTLQNNCNQQGHKSNVAGTNCFECRRMSCGNCSADNICEKCSNDRWFYLPEGSKRPDCVGYDKYWYVFMGLLGFLVLTLAISIAISIRAIVFEEGQFGAGRKLQRDHINIRKSWVKDRAAQYKELMKTK